jgi:two-component system, chemotaxis family, sensor kinase CheA
MNSFVEKFKVEVSEYFERLESRLLQLEHDPENLEIIGEIFRIMHSMKGSGGMFGFDLLSDVTHDLESLYELFRYGNQRVDSDLISFTLDSIDGLKNLMIENPTDEHQLLVSKMKSDTQQQIARFAGIVLNSKIENPTPVSGEKDSETNQATYYISFVPDENIFTNGTNPLYLIDELNALGECNVQVSFDLLPSLAEIDPLKCYVSWYLFVSTSESIETLHDVFIFVANSALITIQKVANDNVIHKEAVLADFLNAQINHESWKLDESNLLEPEESDEIAKHEEKEIAGVLLKSSVEVSKNTGFTQTTVDSIRVDSDKIDQYMNLVSEFITAQSRLEQISLNLKNTELELITETFGKLNNQLRDNAFDMSLIPIESLTVRMKRLIHDLSKSLHKEVVLVTEGMETELDKNIIEKLIEPMLHIIRNSLDHGIESKDERLAKQKEAIGTISIKASTIGSYVQIELEDDGKGLNVDKIREKAIASGLISVQEKTTDEEVFQLIFEPGFSTSVLVTDVSGRGVGMDVVRRSVNAMRGSIELFSEKDRFTRFIIKLPLSLSIIDGLLILIGVSYYIIPSSLISKLYLVRSELLKKELSPVVELDGLQLPYLNLHDEFVEDGKTPEEQFVVVVFQGNHFFALAVDDVIREYQAAIKPLGRMPKGHDIFSGASILGSGQLALVIDTNKLIQKYS